MINYNIFPDNVKKFGVDPITGEVLGSVEDCPRAACEHGQPAERQKELDPALLVLNTKIASRARRLRQFELKRLAGIILPAHRINKCMAYIRPNSPGVELKYSRKFQQGHLGNLIVCSRLWVCPVCAAKITERRRAELNAAFDRGLDNKFSVFMVTVTLQHDIQDRLEDLIRAVKTSWRRLVSGRWYQDFVDTWGILGNVKGFELTYGRVFGWHPHLHILFFTSLSDADLMPDIIKSSLSDRWVSLLERCGYYASHVAGVNVVVGDGQAARYVNKWGLEDEITKSVVKIGRENNVTPWGLLDLFGSGEYWAAGKFQEYAEATKGLQQLRYSAGLRDFLGMDIELDDRDLAELPAVSDDLIFGVMGWRDWFGYLKLKKHPAELLEVLHTGDTVQVDKYLLDNKIHLVSSAESFQKQEREV